MDIDKDIKLIILNNFKKKTLYKKIDTLYIVSKIYIVTKIEVILMDKKSW